MLDKIQLNPVEKRYFIFPGDKPYYAWSLPVCNLGIKGLAKNGRLFNEITFHPERVLLFHQIIIKNQLTESCFQHDED